MTERLATDRTPSVDFPVRGDPPGGNVEDLHELRVRIPVDLHRQLLSLKILRGRSLAETVSIALDIYFAEKAAEASRSSHAD